MENQKQKTNKTDRAASFFIIGIWLFLFVFGLIAMTEPLWLLKISKTDKKQEVTWIVNEGLHYSQRKDYAAAEKIFKKALEILPDMAGAAVNLGVCYKEMGQYDKAITMLNEALTFAPFDSTNVYDNLVDIYNLLGMPEKAELYLEKSLRANHFQIDRYMTEGIFHFNRKEWQPALNAFQNALDIRYDMKINYKDMLQLAMKKHKDNIKIKETIVNLLDKGVNDKDMLAYNNQLFNRMVDLDRKHAENLNKIGFCYAKMSQYQKALLRFEMALRIFPEYSDALLNRLYVTEKINEKKDSVRVD